MNGQGISAPTWLFVPGTLCDARVFDPLCNTLKQKALGAPVRILPALATVSREALADRLVMEAPGKFYVVGFSLGCQIALEIMRRYPDRCLGLILISTTARADAPDMAAVRREMVQDFFQMGPTSFVETRLWKNYVASPDTADPDVRKLIFDMARDTDVTDFARQIELAISRPSSVHDLSCFPAPVLMINGAKDVLTPPNLGAEIATAAIDGTHRIVPKAGHFVLLEQPQRTAEIIQEWIETKRTS